MATRRIVLPVRADVALPEAALSALRLNDPLTAYFAADRWIRLAGECASNLLMRAEAAQRLGFADYACEDLLRARARDPSNRSLLLRLTEWGRGAVRVDAARRLATFSRKDAAIALKCLAESGERGAGELRIEDGRLKGWAAWRSGERAEVRISGSSVIVQDLRAEAGHRLATHFGAATDFDAVIERTFGTRFELVIGERVAARARLPGGAEESGPPIGCEGVAYCILVPVYDDCEATRDCLESVAAEIRRTPGSLALAVDDASPDPAMPEALKAFAGQDRCHVISNVVNLGFVSTVNRGMSRLPYGDILFLNSDTILPPGALMRFARASRIRSDIGVINPLSNHGEFVSYPKPFVANALNPKSWLEIDRAAAAAHDDLVIDIPSATGFCMYVTRACLDVVGLFSDDFDDGYLEDAEFGLRAREAGFRNVCAPAIYVPHLGSRSFGSNKANLVARNRVALARRFPNYEVEVDAFVSQDPLRAVRARLETALASESVARRLLIGPAHWRMKLEEHANRLAEEGVGCLIANFEPVGDQWKLTLRGYDSAAPQNVEVGPNCDVSDFAAALRLWPCDRVEVFGDEYLPASLLRALEADPRSPPLIVTRGSSELTTSLHSERSPAFAQDRIGDTFCNAFQSPNPQRRFEVDGVDIAILYPFETPSSARFLRTFSAVLAKRGLTALAIGASAFGDKWLAEGLLTSGPFQRTEIPRLLAIYAPRLYALPYRGEGHWFLDMVRRHAFAPSAYFRPFADFVGPECDLPLNEAMDDGAASRLLADWAFAKFPHQTDVVERVDA